MSRLAGQRVVVVNWRDLEHSLAGGSEIYAWQLARALGEDGADVTFLTARESGQDRSLERDGIVVRRGGGALTFYLYAACWLLLHRWRLDVVIDMAGGIPSYSPLFVRRRTPVLLLVHHVHQEQFGTHFPAPVAAVGRWMERVAMRAVYRNRRTVAVSHSTRLEMRRQLGWDRPIGLLENGAEVPPVDELDAATKDPDRVVVLGRLVAHKRVDVVLRALRDVVDRPEVAGRDIRLDVVGRGPERESLERLTERLGLAGRVTFHGYVSAAEKAEILRRASVHVCASDAEGWGQVVIEAAGWGVPTVARDVPGLRDSIRPGETGWLVRDAHNLDVVRRRLGECLALALEGSASVGVRAHHAAACHAWAQRFDWSQMRAQARARTEQLIDGVATAAPAHNRSRAARAATAER
ncbi:MAG: glycosyltransferase family 4 protein [Nocardioidaceae bacterium]|nr:glycosyltransferase family 4 protein [Nocardioidaceae bacterium]MCL2613696.1 glycosyltransferase family 4 protein [Nocardioidaceae bacterium]